MPKPFIFRVLALSALGIAPMALVAQGLDVPIYEFESDGEAANCGAGTVMGLKAGGDGFLAVRTGPGASYRKIGELRNGDRVTIFGAQGDWLTVLVPGGKVSPDDACQRVGPKRQLSGSGLGWVHKRWVGNIIP